MPRFLLVLMAVVLLPSSALAEWPALQVPARAVSLDWDRGGIEVQPAHAVPVEGDVDVVELHRTLKVLSTRRSMLTAHQVLAWTSAWTIIAAASVGTVNRIALETGNIPRADMEPLLGLHRSLAATAITTYWSAGVVAWTMPSPSARREHKGLSSYKSTRNTHIALSIAHNIAMGLVTVTGVLQANAIRPKDWQPLMVAHTSSAVAAAGFVLGAAFVIGRL